MIEREFKAAERAETVGSSHRDFGFIVEALDDPADLATLDQRVATGALRVARLIEAARAAAAVPDVTAEGLLWEAWRASGLADRWQAAALGAGSAGARADCHLDAVVGLFESAARFADRLPKAGPQVFLDQVLGQQISGDSLAARAPSAQETSVFDAPERKAAERIARIIQDNGGGKPRG